jgi:glycosyltransferase involved in cell wall biosynthesis
MHILMISDVFFPRVNGVSTSIATFRASLCEHGQHRCTLVVPRYGADDPADPDVHRVTARRVPMDPEDRLMKRRALEHALGSIDATGVDVVHVQTPFIAHSAGVRWAREHGLPVVETWHTHFEEYFHHYVPFLPRRLLKAAARSVSRRQCNALDHIVVPSPAMEDVLRTHGIERPITVVPTGIDRREFARGDGAAFRRRHGVPADRPMLVYVGRVAHEKNLDFLLDMLAALRSRLPGVLLALAGEGPAVAHLRRRVGELGLADTVLFVGYLRRDGELQDCYAAGDLFVFASRTETQGLVLLEALALGVPVVALAALGTREIVLPGRGACAAPDDPVGFASVVAALMRDPDTRARMAQEGRVFAAEWDTAATARRLVAVYEAVIRAQGISPADTVSARA